MEQTRRNWLRKTGLIFAGIGLAKFRTSALSVQDSANNFSHKDPSFINQTNNMKPGAFSVSLNVKDINTSKQFYEPLGFKVFAGD